MKSLTVSNITAVEIQVDPEFIQSKSTAIAASKEIMEVADDFTQSIAVDAARELIELSKTVEKSRTIFKAPILDLGRNIDGKAKELTAEIDAESKRLNILITAYADGKRRAAEAAERARVAEIQCIEREQREAIERERKQAEEKAAAFTREEREIAAQAQRAERARLAELEKQSIAARIQVVAPVKKVEGLTVKKVWKSEVVNLEMLVKKRPDLCKIEASQSAINEAIRNGMRDCPGLRIWEETATSVRI